MSEHVEALIERMRRTIEQKDGQIHDLLKTVDQLNETISGLQSTIANLNETIEEFRRKFFGSSSERSHIGEVLADQNQEPEAENEKITVRRHTRKMGAPQARETTAYWCIKCALEYFQPVYDLLHKYLLECEILHADETICQVLHEKGKAASTNSYMWIYLTGNDGLPSIIMYEYQPGRNGDYAKNFLEGFSGLLECDGYTGYNSVENVILVCCLAHCRRYFFEAIPAARRRKMKLLDDHSPEEIPEEAADPEHAKDTSRPPAEIGLSYCNKLFRVERMLNRNFLEILWSDAKGILS